MKNTLHFIRNFLLVILIAVTIISCIIVLGSESLPTSWVATWVVINICAVFASVYMLDPKIYHRRLVPMCVCIASILYSLLRPVLKLHQPAYQTFRKCYKIRKMSGSLENCYLDVQAVYDEYCEHGGAEC